MSSSKKVCMYKFPLHPREMVERSSEELDGETRMLRMNMILQLADLADKFDQKTIDEKVFVDVRKGEIVGMDCSGLFDGAPNMCVGDRRIALGALSENDWIEMRIGARESVRIGERLKNPLTNRMIKPTFEVTCKVVKCVAPEDLPAEWAAMRDNYLREHGPNCGMRYMTPDERAGWKPWREFDAVEPVKAKVREQWSSGRPSTIEYEVRGNASDVKAFAERMTREYPPGGYGTSFGAVVTAEEGECVRKGSRSACCD